MSNLIGPKELRYLKVLNRLQARHEFLKHKHTIVRLIAECHHVAAVHYRRVGNGKAALKHALIVLWQQPVNLRYWRNVLARNG